MTNSDTITGASALAGDHHQPTPILRRLLATAARALLTIILSSPPAAAVELSLVSAPNGNEGVVMTGFIHMGDAEKFTEFLEQHPRVVGVYLHSPGGEINEALWLARTIRSMKISSIVSDGDECVSACFELFAAGVHRFAGRRAKIGVHRVSYDGNETVRSQALSISYANRIQSYGVPKSILASLMLQPARGMYYLTEDDLNSMHVVWDEPVRAVPYQPEARPLAYKPKTQEQSILAVKPVMPKPKPLAKETPAE